MNRIAELLSPAGDFDTALAAFEAGADAVYCGLADFSARAFAKNLSFDELARLVAYAHAKNRKVYVTFNTVVDEDALDDAISILARLDEIAPDGVIVQDLGVARLCRRHFPGLALHASTQLVAHNLEGVLALKALGFVRVVLARELSLAEVASISKRCGDLELECFIHGALCYSLSGLCLFSAMENDRSGNRGKCAYCCRQQFGATKATPFSMKDLRLGEEVRKLVEAGVASLKIEGRMKSALYVASVTKYYRQILDGFGGEPPVTVADLETVFSRRTTTLHFDGHRDDVVDSTALGHVGTPVGTVKRVTKDRDGRSWIRFHTARALERHDGLQFASQDGGRPVGFGITEMRRAISRANVFEVPAGADVEVLIPDDLADKCRGTVYCSMSNAVKRRFPAPAFRPSEYPAGSLVDVTVALSPDGVRASSDLFGRVAECSVQAELQPAKNPEKTYAAVEKAFSKLGETGYRLGRLSLVDEDRVFAPMNLLNDLRRRLVEKFDEAREAARRKKIAAAVDDRPEPPVEMARSVPRRTVKLRLGQTLPAGEWHETVVAVSPHDDLSQLAAFAGARLALPVYNPELEFGRLRVMVKRLAREGWSKWEASDLATLSLLRSAGVSEISADWTLYAFNSSALAELHSLGAGRFVASPENDRENLQYLAESGYDVEFLVQQSTPLFVSLNKPAFEDVEGLRIFRRDGLWVATRPVPRTFAAPDGVSTRIDLSWEGSRL